ncbi:MAG: hypothetical protein F6K45_24095 [Kamptonema sp. SIO1D9]|nr:hypothetical protein [Kamptonema sp. SIO1D9]
MAESAYDLAVKLGVIGAAKGLPADVSFNPDYLKDFVGSMSPKVKDVFTQIDSLNKEERLEVLHYLEQRVQEDERVEEGQSIDANYEHLLQYISETKNTECRRPLQDFRGIAPNLLEGQDAQEWVSQMRNESDEREQVWRKLE